MKIRGRQIWPYTGNFRSGNNHTQQVNVYLFDTSLSLTKNMLRFFVLLSVFSLITQVRKGIAHSIFN